MEILAILLIVLAIIVQLNISKIRGAIGEKRVKNQLSKLPHEDYVILNNIMVETERGTSQIDHVVVSPYGIFVIETKNFSGWIHGSENSEYWVQTIYRKKANFRNPVKQNWGHIQTLKSALPDYQHVPFYSIVVFAGGTLKNVNTKTDVIYDYMLYDTIMSHRGMTVISREDMESIARQLQISNISDRKARKKHIRQVKSTVSEKKAKIYAMKCPKCGTDLVKRSGPYGEFYGCPNYPKCKYKINL